MPMPRVFKRKCNERADIIHSDHLEARLGAQGKHNCAVINTLAHHQAILHEKHWPENRIGHPDLPDPLFNLVLAFKVRNPCISVRGGN